MPDSSLALAPPSLFRRLFISLLAVAFGLFLALLLVEILLHFYNPFLARIKGNHIVLQANMTRRFHNGSIAGLDPDIVVTRNALGFRGPNPPPDFASYLKIFAVGGSTTHGVLSSEGKTWPALAAASLDASFRKLWVNNAGLDGHSTFGHAILLADQVLPQHPQVVLLLIGANDVAASEPNGHDAESLRGAGISFSDPKKFVKAISTYSEIAALGLNIYRSWVAYRAGLPHAALDLTHIGTVNLTEAEQQARINSTARPELLEAYRQRVLGLVNSTRQAGAVPILITQPTLWGQGIDDITGINLALARLPVGNGETSWRILERYNDVTRSICAATQTPCIDLAHQLPKSRLIFYDSLHYTNEGNRQTGAIVSAFLCPLLKERFPNHASGPCPSPTSVFSKPNEPQR